MLSEVVTCNCVRNPGGHAESNPRPSEEGVSFYHVLRQLDRGAAVGVEADAVLPTDAVLRSGGGACARAGAGETRAMELFPIGGGGGTTCGISRFPPPRVRPDAAACAEPIANSAEA